MTTADRFTVSWMLTALVAGSTVAVVALANLIGVFL